MERVAVVVASAYVVYASGRMRQPAISPVS